MKHIVSNGLRCYGGFKILPKNVIAMTVFKNIFFRESFDELKEHINQHDYKVVINHEKIHMLQAATFKTKYFGFYLRYLYEWVKNLFIYGTRHDKAYYMICFEREAYRNEQDFSYSTSYWRAYLQ